MADIVCILRNSYRLGAQLSTMCICSRTHCFAANSFKRHELLSALARYQKKTLRQGVRLYSQTRYRSNTHLSRLMKAWTEKLSQQGVPEADTSVDLIVAHAFGKKMIHEVDMNTQASAQIIQRIDDMCKERSKRIPVQYIIGEWDFHDMTFEMRPPVLIPRPETEELADIIVKSWKDKLAEDVNFLEIGCGTGALSLYILRQMPKARCVAVDKNEVACDLTLKNAAPYNLQQRIHVIQGDILDGTVISDISSHGPFDLLVSNPPYLTSDEMQNIEAEVSDYEDHGALHGGTDGLDLIRHILAVSYKFLRPKQSVVWLEVGLQQPEKVREITESHPEYLLSYEETLKDFTQRERFCKLMLNGR